MQGGFTRSLIPSVLALLAGLATLRIEASGFGGKVREKESFKLTS